MEKAPYHNTNKETGWELDLSKSKAISQEENIMDIFKQKEWLNQDPLLSPAEIWAQYCSEFKEVPITSIRRAISNLTNKYDLVKTDIMRVGLYGKQEHCWKLARDDGQLKLL